MKIARPKAADFGFLEKIVATQNFIRTFTGYNHFEAILTHQF